MLRFSISFVLFLLFPFSLHVFQVLTTLLGLSMKWCVCMLLCVCVCVMREMIAAGGGDDESSFDDGKKGRR